MRVCLVAGGLDAEHERRQPWRYLAEVARGLSGQGISLQIITDVTRGQDLKGLDVSHVPSVRSTWWGANRPLLALLDKASPDRVIWHTGVTSFLYLHIPERYLARSVAAFTTPLHTWSEVRTAGLCPLFRERELSAVHLLGLLVPALLVRHHANAATLRKVVTLSTVVRDRLVRRGADPNCLQIIPPGVNPSWTPLPATEVAGIRGRLGFGPKDLVVAYAGSPMRLRGIDLLIHATARALKDVAQLRLLVLSRTRPGEMEQAGRRVRALAARKLPEGVARFVTGFLSEEEIRLCLSAADIVALPFQLVPSDMPLSVLEAQALGKPVVAARVGCLEEIVQPATGVLVPAGESRSLAEALSRLCSDTGERLRMGQAARGLSEKRPTWGQVVQAWGAILRAP